MKIKIECDACNATGLYQGFAEPKDTAVICNCCGGTGCQEIIYKPFESRKRKRNIKYVMGDGGLWFARSGKEKKITVEEFYRK